MQIGNRTPDTGSNSSDQRYFPRWEVSNRVLYQLERRADISQGKTKDLSCAGACIRVDEPIDKQRIKLTLFLNGNTSIAVEGDVLWHRPSDDGNVEVGISFHELSPQAQEVILQYAFEVNRQEVVNHWFDGWNDSPKKS